LNGIAFRDSADDSGHDAIQRSLRGCFGQITFLGDGVNQVGFIHDEFSLGVLKRRYYTLRTQQELGVYDEQI
jgi:hypothetical protein